MDYQDFFGWADVSSLFSFTHKDGDLAKILGDNLGAVMTSDEDGKIYLKVRYGCSLFVIYSKGGEPWHGVGIGKEYCLSGSRREYELIGKEGSNLLHIQDNRQFDLEGLAADVRSYVKPIMYHISHRPDLLQVTEALTCPTAKDASSVMESLEQHLPMTAREFLEVVDSYVQRNHGHAAAKDLGHLFRRVAPAILDNHDYTAQKSTLDAALKSLFGEK
jgi:hypothetical protein